MRRPFILLMTVVLVSVGLSVVAPAAQADSAVFPVKASADDAEQGSSATGLTSSDLELLYDSTLQTVGLRFTGVSFRGGRRSPRPTSSSPPTGRAPGRSATVHGQAADNAAAFTTSSTSVEQPTRTAASVVWQPAAWSSGTRSGPADAEPVGVVQEIVNRAGWAPGNAIAVRHLGLGHRQSRGVVLRRPGVRRPRAARRVDDGRHPAAEGLLRRGGQRRRREGRPPGRPRLHQRERHRRDRRGGPPPSGAVPTPATYGFPDCSRGGTWSGPTRPGRC